MEKKYHIRSFSRGSLDSSSDAPSEPVRLVYPVVGPEQAVRAAGRAKVYGSSTTVKSVAQGNQKASTDEEGSESSSDEAASKKQQRPRGSVNTLELSASGRAVTSAVGERQGNISHFATLPRRVRGSQDHFATLPRPHPAETTPPSAEEKHNAERTSLVQKVMSSDLKPSIPPVENSIPSNSMEAEKTDIITTTTTTTTTTSTIWPQDTKFVSLDALESFNKQLQILAESEVDNEVDFYDKVISGLQEKIDELHDTILKVEHNGQLSVKMAEQRALEAETRLRMMTEKAQKCEQRCVLISLKCKDLEAALQKTAILQERDRAVFQRNHLPQRMQSARELEYLPRIQSRLEPRHHMTTGRQADRSPPQALQPDSSPPQALRSDSSAPQALRSDSIPSQTLRSDSIPSQALRSDSIPSQGELYPNRSLTQGQALDQSPGHGQYSERTTHQSQQNDWNLAQSSSVERNPNQGQTMRNLIQSQNPSQGQVVRNPNQHGQAMRSTTQSQMLDWNPSSYNYKHVVLDKSQPTMQQNGAIISTETTV